MKSVCDIVTCCLESLFNAPKKSYCVNDLPYQEQKGQSNRLISLHLREKNRITNYASLNGTSSPLHGVRTAHLPDFMKAMCALFLTKVLFAKIL